MPSPPIRHPRHLWHQTGYSVRVKMLEGKTVVVTGGNTGIGSAIALAAGAAGANVVIDYLVDPVATEALVAQIEDSGGRAIGLRADVTEIADLHSLVREATNTFGRLDVFVNNAGIENRTGLLNTSVEDFEKVLAVNLKSAFFGSQAAAKQFIAQGGGGLIINISSVHEDWPMPGNIAYCVAKGGLRMLTRTAAVELAPHGVRMINVAPGAVDTPINRVTEEDPAALTRLDAAIPLGRMAQPSEIADVVVLLATDANRYMTATTVVIDGGIMQGSVGL